MSLMRYLLSILFFLILTKEADLSKNFSSGTKKNILVMVNASNTRTELSNFNFNKTLLPNTSNSTKVDANEPPLSKPEVTFGSIEEFCLLVNITLQNCNCERSSIVCEFQKLMNFHEDERDTLPLSKIYASISIVTSVLGLIGNTAVILVSYKYRNSMQLYKKHIAMLAFIDFIFSIVQIVDVARLFWKVEWIYGLALCKIIRSILLLCNLLSIGFITMIAVERYFGIIHPFKNRTKRINIFSILHIVVAVSTVFPYTASLTITNKTKRCEEKWYHGKGASLFYQWYLAIVYFALPVCIITFLYKKIIKNLSDHVNASAVLIIKIQRKKRFSDNRRIMYILISIMVAFVVFTLPNRVLWIYGVTTEYKHISSGTYFVLMFISYLTYPFHICVNPIIYSVIDKKWRTELINIILRRKHFLDTPNFQKSEKTDSSDK